MRVNHAKSRITAIANVNHAVTDADSGWPDYHFSSAQLDLAGLESSYLRDGIGCLIDYIHAPGVARWHPQFSRRAIVGDVVERHGSSRAR